MIKHEALLDLTMLKVQGVLLGHEDGRFCLVRTNDAGLINASCSASCVDLAVAVLTSALATRRGLSKAGGGGLSKLKSSA